MKKRSTLLIIREIQIKTTPRYHLTSTRIVVIKKIQGKCWQGSREKGTLVYCCWNCKLLQPLWKTVWRILKTLKKKKKKHYCMNPAIILLGIYAREKNHYVEEIYSASCSQQCDIYNSQGMETTQCPSIDEQGKNLQDTHTHTKWDCIQP